MSRREREHEHVPTHESLPLHSCHPYTPSEHARALRLVRLIERMDYLADEHLRASAGDDSAHYARVLVLGERVMRVVDVAAHEWASALARSGVK